MSPASLRKTIVALQSVARAPCRDALAAAVDGFLKDFDEAEGSPAKLEALRVAVDAWLAQVVGTLLVRVTSLLAHDDVDLGAVREVLRASWVLLTDMAGAERSELASVGGLLSASLERKDLVGARCALVSARDWWEAHQLSVGAAARRAFRSE